MSLTLPSLQILKQNSDGGISNFRISGQSIIKENYHNARTRDDIDMNVRAVTKLDKRNRTTSRKFDHDAMLANCDVIVIFIIFGQFGAIQKLHTGHKINRALVLKGIFSEPTYVCVLTYQISCF